MNKWQNKALAYRDSFALVCAGTIPVILSQLNSGIVADIGCGTGNFSQAANEAGFQVLACDAQADMLALAAELLAKTTVQLRLDSLPELASFANHSAANTVANFVINHVPNPRACLQGLSRITKANGQIITTIWPKVFLPHRDLAAELIAKYDTTSQANQNNSVNDSTIEPDFERSPTGLAQLNTEAGLEVITNQMVQWQWKTTWDEFWLGIESGIGHTGETFLAQPTTIQEKIKAEVSQSVTAYQVQDSLIFPCQAALCIAKPKK